MRERPYPYGRGEVTLDLPDEARDALTGRKFGPADGPPSRFDFRFFEFRKKLLDLFARRPATTRPRELVCRPSHFIVLILKGQRFGDAAGQLFAKGEQLGIQRTHSSNGSGNRERRQRATAGRAQRRLIDMA